MEARCVFIDGPVAVYVSEASGTEILLAYARLARLVQVAADTLETEREQASCKRQD